jgi:hypothetical protein
VRDNPARAAELPRSFARDHPLAVRDFSAVVVGDAGAVPVPLAVTVPVPVVAVASTTAAAAGAGAASVAASVADDLDPLTAMLLESQSASTAVTSAATATSVRASRAMAVGSRRCAWLVSPHAFTTIWHARALCVAVVPLCVRACVHACVCLWVCRAPSACSLPTCQPQTAPATGPSRARSGTCGCRRRPRFSASSTRPRR